MDDPIFDAIFALCEAADDDGYVAVADALEMVLDVYLLERNQRLDTNGGQMAFQSRRTHEQTRTDQVAEWTAALSEDGPAPISVPTPNPLPDPISVNWSSMAFPLARVSNG